MKKKLYLLLILVLSVSILSCSQEPAGKRKILAKINDFELPFDEFEEKLVQDLNVEADYKLNKETKREFLEQLIREELLVQEGARLRLDREEKFIKGIERYWKATLIRAVMEVMSDSITKKTYVSQEEFDAHYNYLKKNNYLKKMNLAMLPKEDMEQAIIEILKEKKKTEKLKEWITELRKNARIEINEDLL